MIQTHPFGCSPLLSTRLIYGCMRIVGGGEVTDERIAEARKAILAAWEAGYNHFDHANIYGGGECERVFGQVLAEVPEMRRRAIITTKCGIRTKKDPEPGRPKRFDFSREHILSACEASLSRLGIETIDVYLLHRPDRLMDVGEVAGAFEELRRTGKVRYFGVSNFTPSQVDLLQSALDHPLVCQQILINPTAIESFVDGRLDQCQRRHITPTAWSPVAGGLFADGGAPKSDHPDRERIEAILETLDAAAAEYGVGRSVITLAWLMRHPSGIMPIIGTTNPQRIAEAVRADEVSLDRETWYRIYNASFGELP